MILRQQKSCMHLEVESFEVSGHLQVFDHNVAEHKAGGKAEVFDRRSL
jgi:hypothetical protein